MLLLVAWNHVIRYIRGDNTWSEYCPVIRQTYYTFRSSQLVTNNNEQLLVWIQSTFYWLEEITWFIFSYTIGQIISGDLFFLHTPACYVILHISFILLYIRIQLVILINRSVLLWGKPYIILWISVMDCSISLFICVLGWGNSIAQYTGIRMHYYSVNWCRRLL